MGCRYEQGAEIPPLPLMSLQSIMALEQDTGSKSIPLPWGLLSYSTLLYVSVFTLHVFE